jgi:hypothetical protein
MPWTFYDRLGQKRAASASTPANPQLIFDVVVGRGQAGDPAAPAAVIDTNTILGGNLPSAFKYWKLFINGRGDQAASTAVQVFAKLNNDATIANYYDVTSSGNGATVGSAQDLASLGGWFIGYLTAASSVANVPGSIEATFYDPANTVFAKAMTAISQISNSNSSGASSIQMTGGRYLQTAALTRIALSLSAGNFIAGTRVSMYGMP